MFKEPFAEEEEKQSRYVPDEYEGKLESNYYCRRWIASKNKYCEQRAGHNTFHSGVGRCKTHDGGANRMTEVTENSKYKEFVEKRDMSDVERYRRLPKKLQGLYEEQSSDPDPLNVERDIRLARSILIDYIARYEDMREKLDEWYEWYKSEINSNPPKVDLLPVEHVITFLKKVTDIAHKERKIRSNNAVSEADLYKIMGKMGKVVEHWVMKPGMKPEEKLKNIKEDWLEIEIDR